MVIGKEFARYAGITSTKSNDNTTTSPCRTYRSLFCSRRPTTKSGGKTASTSTPDRSLVLWGSDATRTRERVSECRSTPSPYVLSTSKKQQVACMLGREIRRSLLALHVAHLQSFKVQEDVKDTFICRNQVRVVGQAPSVIGRRETK